MNEDQNNEKMNQEQDSSAREARRQELMEMFNPVLKSSSGSYETEEGCLSLEGQRKTKRYQYIKVRYQDRSLIWHVKRFSGWEAQIIQHEIDHCKGVMI